MSVDWTYWPSEPWWTDSSLLDYRPPWLRPVRPGTMRWALQQTVAPTTEPIDLDTAKRHLRVDGSDDDSLILTHITAARMYVEMTTGLSLLSQTWKLYLDRWPRLDRNETWPWVSPPGTILLPRFPVQSVTNIQWFDVNGGTNTVASTDYLLDAASRIPRVTPAANKYWPTSPSLVPQNGVVVTFPAGAVTLAAVPATLLQAMLLLIGVWYENREDVVIGPRLVAVPVPKAVDALLGLHAPMLVG